MPIPGLNSIFLRNDNLLWLNKKEFSLQQVDISQENKVHTELMDYLFRRHANNFSNRTDVRLNSGYLFASRKLKQI